MTQEIRHIGPVIWGFGHHVMFKSFRDNRGKFSGQPGQPGQTGANRAKPGHISGANRAKPGQTGASRKSSQGLVLNIIPTILHCCPKIRQTGNTSSVLEIRSEQKTC